MWHTGPVLSHEIMTATHDITTCCKQHRSLRDEWLKERKKNRAGGTIIQVDEKKKIYYIYLCHQKISRHEMLTMTTTRCDNMMAYNKTHTHTHTYTQTHTYRHTHTHTHHTHTCKQTRRSHLTCVHK
jgi:hypothetical protein